MNDINYSTINPILESQNLNNIFNHFWNRWQKESLYNLRVTHKPNKLPATLPIIEVNDTVMAYVKKLPRSQWKLRLVPGRDAKVRGAKIGLSRTNTIVTKHINKPYLVKRLNTNNTSTTINKDTVQKNTRPKRKATFISNMKTKFCT